MDNGENKPQNPIAPGVSPAGGAPAGGSMPSANPAQPAGSAASPAPSPTPLSTASAAAANKEAAGKVLSPKEAFMKALAESDQGGASGPKKSTCTLEDARMSSNVIDFVDQAIENAAILGVSDIHFEVYDENARIRYRRDGVLQEIEELHAFLQDNYSAVTTRVKILASLDISERRLPQDGRIHFVMSNGDDIDIRVSVLPTQFGERIVMRLMSRGAISMELDKLGFSEYNFKNLTKAIRAPQGMILVTGPTGSGKSTTLYAVLNSLNNEDVNILTAEDPVEYSVEGIGQVHVKENIGLTFSAALRSFLRQDPEVIMVGEIRDKETGDIAVKAALTGHLVLSTLHTNDAPSTITRMINMGIPSYLITASLSLVIAQRLARVICDECKTDDVDVTKDMLMAIGFTEADANEVKPKVGKGCEKCMNTGVKGRRAVHEVLALNDTLRQAIIDGASEIKIKEMAIKDGFETMQLVGRKLVKEGSITVREYQRILVLD